MITATDIIAWGPCEEYSADRIRELVGPGITPQQIAESNIPIADKIWTLLHEHEDLFTTSQLHLLACDFADQALALIDDPDPRSLAAVATKRKWVAEEATDSELAAARDAALAAAWDAAGDAAWAAMVAWAAARDAARDAVWAAARAAMAARDAARDAVWDAAWAAMAAGAAARDAAREKQLKFILAKLSPGVGT